MNWIDLDVEKIVDCINNEYFDYVFPKIDRKCLSYFETYDVENEVYIDEFGFSTIPELRELLKRKKVIKNPEIDIICAISVFKNKPSIQKNDKEMESEEEYILPTFIYNF